MTGWVETMVLLQGAAGQIVMVEQKVAATLAKTKQKDAEEQEQMH